MRQKFIMCGLLLTALLFSSNGLVFHSQSQSEPNYIVSSRALTTPIIDGIITAGEWGEPLIETWFNRSFSPPLDDESHEVIVYVMNDNVNLFIGVILTNDDFNTTDSFDRLEIVFDSNNNDIIDTYEDIKVFSELDYQDWFLDPGGTSTKDQSIQLQKDGNGEATHSNLELGDYNYEFQIPLNSGEISDISASAGDTLGIRISFSEYTDTKTGGTFGFTIGTWPENASDRSDLTNYGNLVLVDSDTETNSKSEDKAFVPFLFTPFLITFIFILSIRKRIT